jgi:ribonuclease BN (tRNA processing enzyme)
MGVRAAVDRPSAIERITMKRPMDTKRGRRRFMAQTLGAVAGAIGASRRIAAGRRARPARPSSASVQATPRSPRNGLRLVLLGTAGGPTPKASRAAPAQALLFKDAAYVVDCGNGVARQLRLAGIALPSIRHVFLTHHHSDHNADYGNLLLLAWASDLTTAVDAWGPPPLKKMTALFLEMNETDIRVRMADEGRPPLAPLVRPHEITAEGAVLREAGLTVTCVRVHHPLVEHALAYRFDSTGRSIVISGDTSPSDNLVRLARNADVLVHEVMYLPAIEKLTQASPDPAALKRHLLASHTPVEEAGRVAAEANVRTLVLSHFVPGEASAVSDSEWLEGAKKHFKGEVILGKDLLEI